MIIIQIKINNTELYWVMLHVGLFRCLLLKLLQWAKICIGVSSKIFLQWVKWIYKKEIFLKAFELVYAMRCVFDGSRKVIKGFDS